jgi:hypothetical protein
MQAVKTGTPSVDPKALHQELLRTPMDDFVSVVVRLRGREAPNGQQPDQAVSPKLLQLMHFQLIEAQQRIRHLEGRPPALPQQAGLRDEPSRLRSAVRRLIARL